jgi:hypothetical protein
MNNVGVDFRKRQTAGSGRSTGSSNEKAESSSISRTSVINKLRNIGKGVLTSSNRLWMKRSKKTVGRRLGSMDEDEGEGSQDECTNGDETSS